MEKKRNNITNLTGRRNGRHSTLFMCAAALAFTGLFGLSPAQTYAAPVASQVSQSNTHRVTGTVLDENGEPIIGASIIEKGTSNGVATDIDGKFVLNVGANATVSVSYIGYEPQDVKVNGQSTLNITLKENAQVLDDVVVVGFGTQKKVNLTGSVATVDTKVLEDRPVANAVQALQGAVPGMLITNNSGALDQNASIQVRGTGTIGSSSSSPLILIDGMEGDINTINPQDIESISVLKDAAASSIYGSRAPFGVILITTKSGSQGKAKVSYSNNFRWGKPTRIPDMVNSLQFIDYYNEANINAGNGQYFPDGVRERAEAYINGDTSAQMLVDANGIDWRGDWNMYASNTDWYDVVYKDWAFSQEHNLNVSGGTEKVSYYASAGYLKQSGLSEISEDTMKRYTLTAKMSAELSSWARLDLSTRFVRKDMDRPRGLGGALYDNLSMNFWPTHPLIDNNGNMMYGVGPELKRIAEGGYNYNNNDDINFQGALVLEPIKGWVTHLEANYRIVNYSSREEGLPMVSYNALGEATIGYDKDSYVSKSHERSNYMNINAYTEYARSFGKHNGKIMFGFQTEGYRRENDSYTAYGLINYDYPWGDLTTDTSYTGEELKPNIGGNYNRWTTAGFFGRLNYDYNGIYLFEANLRYDGTSRFKKDSRWGLFPSFSAGYNIANEEFWEPYRNIVNTLKVRGSYGQLGNQNTNNWYSQYEQMVLSTAAGNWIQNGAKPNTAIYPNSSGTHNMVSTLLTWERIKNWNVGLDWGLLSNRLTGSFDYYQRKTTGMVANGPELPAVLGANNPQINNTDLLTSGFELQISWNDRLANGFGYNITATLSDSRAKVTKYSNNPTHDLGNYIEGEYLGNIYGYETVGIANSQEEMDAYLDMLDRNYEAYHGVAPETPRMGQSQLGDKWSAGDVMYADLDGDGIINSGENTLEDHGDLKKIGNNRPRYSFGITLGADWKGFDVSAFFQGILKRDIWQDSWLFWGATGDARKSTCFTQHLDYWSEDNTDAYYPRPYFNGSRGDFHLNKNQYTQTRYLQNAAYIRLKNIQFGYTLPQNLTKKAGIERLRLYLSGENLWVGTKMAEMFDPETVDGGNGSGKNANIGEAYPLSKTISFGINLTI